MIFPDSLTVPAEIIRIVERLEEHGFEAWCVGGAVRDALLDQPHQDFDIATSATPTDVMELFRRTVPIGVEHGTVAVLDGKARAHEVTSFRRDVTTDGRHATVQFGVDLDEDLARRDFTINAIAYHPVRHAWRDPFDGLTDLDGGLVRAVGDPATRFREDYLRIVRAIRFATRLDFAIDAPTWSAAKDNAAGLGGLSAERIRDEWFKSLQGARRTHDVVQQWQEVGALDRWLPEIHEAVPGGLDALDRLGGGDPVLTTAFLANGRAAQLLTRLRCSRAEIERGAAVDALRAEAIPDRDARAVRHWLARAGDAADDLLTVWSAEGRAAELPAAVNRVRAEGCALSLSDLEISGTDLMELGVEQGPEIGRILKSLLKEVLDDPSANTRARLLELVEELIE